MKIQNSLLFLFFISSSLFAQRAVDFYQDGLVAFEQNHYYESLDLFKQALLENPSYKEALMGLSQSYFMIEEYEQAFHYGEKAYAVDSEDLSILNLLGRIHLARGNFEEAQSFFDKVLLVEPNNQEALFGKAEILVFKGAYSQGASLFEKSLTYNSESRRALLSLVLLFEKKNDLSQAESYLLKALQLFPSDIVTLSQGTAFYIRQKGWDSALSLAKRWNSLSSSQEAQFQLAYIYQMMKEYSKGIATYKEILSQEAQVPLVWFNLAKCYEANNQIDKALLSYKTLLIVDPYDELGRMAYENFLISHFSIDHPQRSLAAQYHFKLGRNEESRYYFEQAGQEYRQGRLLAPLDLDGWWLYAQNFKKQNDLFRYKEESDALYQQGYNNANFLRLYSLVDKGDKRYISNRWNNKISFNKSNIKLSIFIDKSRSFLIHKESENDLGEYLNSLLKRNMDLDIQEVRVLDSGAQAFKHSRLNGSDFYIILEFQEKERSFRLDANILLGQTGQSIRQISQIKNGKYRISTALSQIGYQIEQTLPLKAQLLGFRGDTLLVSSGRRGVSLLDKSLLLVQSGEYKWTQDSPYISYEAKDLLGELHIKEQQGALALGDFTPFTPFETLKIGDELFLKPENFIYKPLEESLLNEELKTQLLKLY